MLFFPCLGRFVKICLPILLLWGAFPALSRAQFQGGKGDGYDMAELSVTLTPLDSPQMPMETLKMQVFPNPIFLASESHFSIVLENFSFQHITTKKDFTLWLQDAQGKSWQLDFEPSYPNKMSVQLPKNLALGCYFLVLMQNQKDTKSVQVQILIQE
ncbi:hypothetical protein [Hugenholtzia roseola]|uniref:hypothetical protein n=1 Tax=Hugenholtzia roseola TaxID=1002 RepID=UPI0003F89F33|nr:hypothetical protein [Hugenholtzia roseola]